MRSSYAEMQGEGLKRLTSSTPHPASQLEEQQVEMRSSYAEMQGEGLKRLTCMVRDKELEMSSLKEKHQSILQLLEQERSNQQKLELENQELKLLSEKFQKDLVDQE